MVSAGVMAAFRSDFQVRSIVPWLTAQCTDDEGDLAWPGLPYAACCPASTPSTVSYAS